MEEKKTVFDYIYELFIVFGIIVLIFMVFALLVGDKAMATGRSSLFSMGSRGLALKTLFQHFFLALMITVINNLFMTDRWIRKMSLKIRNICFICGIFVTVAAFSIAFAWFPTDSIRAWIAFLISFVICTVLGIGIGRLEEKAENEKMNRALERLQDKKKDG